MELSARRPSTVYHTKRDAGATIRAFQLALGGAAVQTKDSRHFGFVKKKFIPPASSFFRRPRDDKRITDERNPKTCDVSDWPCNDLSVHVD